MKVNDSWDEVDSLPTEVRQSMSLWFFPRNDILHRPFTAWHWTRLPRNNRCFSQMQLWIVWWLQRWVIYCLIEFWMSHTGQMRTKLTSSCSKKIVPKCSTKFVVVHVWLVFSHPPQLGHVVGVYEAKLSSPILLPTNDLRVLFGVGQQFKQKLPKLNLSTLRLTGRWKEMSVIGFCDFWNETKILSIFAYLQLMLNWWTNIDYMNAYLGIFVKALAY